MGGSRDAELRAATWLMRNEMVNGNQVQTVDFGRSYVRFRVDCLAQEAITVTHFMPTTVNNVRIALECRCELIELGSGQSHVYVLGASCKTERVGAKDGCWLEPNADFCLATSEQEFLIFKSWARNDMAVAKHPRANGVPRERQSGRCREAWADFGFQVRPARGRTLTTINDTIAAIRGDRPLVARTEYEDGDYRVIIEHPVKTINFSEREHVFQTDTGPILLPDLTPARLQRGERLIDCFDLAYSAFNSAGWAEFIVNVPTPVGDRVSVNHYSRTRRIEPTHNVLFEVLDDVRPPMHSLADGQLLRVDAAETADLNSSSRGDYQFPRSNR